MKLSARLNRILTSALAVLAIWAVGAMFVAFPLGDGLQRLSYDCLYLFARQQPDPDVVIVALNENTDRALGLQQGEPFSRAHHARLVERLAKAGCERIIYDILFDLPSNDPKADEAFRNAIAAHGRVILGGALDRSQQDEIDQSTIYPPHKPLRDAAEAWGTLNVEPIDPDGTVRRFPGSWELAPPLAIAAAKAATPAGQSIDELKDPWLLYVTPPGQISIYELSECLDPATLPDHLFRGKTVLVGGTYSTDAIGSRDVHRTPYSRFGAPPMTGVEWHANAFLNARDRLWMQSATVPTALLWCLPLALAGIPIIWNRRPWLNAVLILVGGIILSLIAIYATWNNRLLIPWLVPITIQLPVALTLQFSHALLAPRTKFLAPVVDPGYLDDLVVFISFSRMDLEAADRICGFLNDNGIKAWIYKDRVPAGAQWPEHLSKAIASCELVLFLLSKGSLDSALCLRELNVASLEGKPILPMRLDDAKISNDARLLMGFEQRIEAASLPLGEEMFSRLLEGIGRIRKRGKEDDSTT